MRTRSRFRTDEPRGSTPSSWLVLVGSDDRPPVRSERRVVRVADLAASGVLSPVIDRSFTFKEIAAAVRYVEPVAVSFTVETDGRPPDGTPLRTAVERVDAVAPPEWFGINCAHPEHMAPAFDGGTWQERVGGMRPDASALTHNELDVMEQLDEGDLALFTSSFERLRPHPPNLAVVGGCCGTDARHVASLWGQRFRDDAR